LLFPSSWAASARARSVARAKRLEVPRAMTEEALVRMAGAAMKVSTAKGLVTSGSIRLPHVRVGSRQPAQSRAAAPEVLPHHLGVCGAELPVAARYDISCSGFLLGRLTRLQGLHHLGVLQQALVALEEVVGYGGEVAVELDDLERAALGP